VVVAWGPRWMISAEISDVAVYLRLYASFYLAL
jgi:hypothetical protein